MYYMLLCVIICYCMYVIIRTEYGLMCVHTYVGSYATPPSIWVRRGATDPLLPLMPLSELLFGWRPCSWIIGELWALLPLARVFSPIDWLMVVVSV